MESQSLDNHLLFCNQLASYQDFSVLMTENKKVLLEMNRNIASALLFLFDKVE